jgi:hypothetical protein
MYAFYTIMKINYVYFLKQHQQAGLCNASKIFSVDIEFLNFIFVKFNALDE